MSQFPVEPATKYIFGFHLTYPLLHCGLLLPMCLEGFHFLYLLAFSLVLVFLFKKKKMKKVLVVACATYSLVNLPQKMWKMHDIEQVCSCLSPFLLLMKCRQIQNLTWSWLTTSSLKEAWKVSLALFWGLLFLINRVIGQEKAEEWGVCASLSLFFVTSLFLRDPSFLHGAGLEWDDHIHPEAPIDFRFLTATNPWLLS